MSTLDKNHNRMHFASITLVLNLHPVRKKKKIKKIERVREILHGPLTTGSHDWLKTDLMVARKTKTQQNVFSFTSFADRRVSLILHFDREHVESPHSSPVTTERHPRDPVGSVFTFSYAYPVWLERTAGANPTVCE